MFRLAKVENGRINVAEPEFYPGGSAAITQGEGLKLSSGKLVVCGATTKPSFIALADAGANAAEVPVIPVTPEQIYEADASVSVAAAVVGTKVTLTATGDEITATTSDGVATILAILDTKKALVKFE
ncbi:MAG: hypothetical protein IJT60_05675 [Clostridia bacterium]|nr:hypothetical protein [Clostridia bacterium]